MHPSVLCISHGKDVDGLASAALVKMAKKAKVLLADYGDFVPRLKRVKQADELYVCDLGLNSGTAEAFVREARRIRGFASITYIDHHPLRPPLKKRIRDAGVKLVHSTKECTSVLIHSEMKTLPKDAALLACYGAVTDYMDSQPMARRLIQRYDRQFILLEASMLAYAVVRGRRSDPAFAGRVVESLAKLELPHRIEGVAAYAGEQADVVADLMKRLRKEGRRGEGYAYVEAKDQATGTVANILMGVFNTPVGVACHIDADEGVLEASLRGSDACRKHLGTVAAFVAERLGGSGGGHARASGIRIPASKLRELLNLLNQALASP